jgi:hypothetical protein
MLENLSILWKRDSGPSPQCSVASSVIWAWPTRAIHFTRACPARPPLDRAAGSICAHCLLSCRLLFHRATLPPLSVDRRSLVSLPPSFCRHPACASLIPSVHPCDQRAPAEPIPHGQTAIATLPAISRPAPSDSRHPMCTARAIISSVSALVNGMAEFTSSL